MTQQPSRGRRGMAVAPHGLAAQSALAVLREGGNAIEAMVAAAATIASTALPPALSTSRPAWAARWWGATNRPPVAWVVFSITDPFLVMRPCLYRQCRRGHHQPIAVGSQVASCGKLNTTATASACRAT